MTRYLNRRALVFVLAAALMLVLVPLGDDDTATASHTDCHSERNHALWITNVDISEELPSNDDETYLPGDRAAFVESGTELIFEVEIQNRYDDEACQVDWNPNIADNLKLQLRYLDIQGEDEVHINEEFVTSCPGDNPQRADPGQTCTETIRLPTSVNNEVQPTATDSGEQRIRFVVYDEESDTDGAVYQDGEFKQCATESSITTGDEAFRDNVGVCAGAERILVVDKLPDLAVSDITLPNGQPHTATDANEKLTADIEITNNGDYANWNPNGAGSVDQEYWARSSFDANGDGVPEEDHDEDTERDPDTDTGPRCNRGAQTHTDWPFSTEGDSEDDVRCSYRPGIPLQLPIWYELHRTDDDSLLENGMAEFYNSQDIESANTDKDHTILADSSDSDEIDLITLYKRAGEYDLTVHVDRDTEELPEGEFFNVPESDEDDNDREETIDILGVDLAITEPRVSVQTAEGGSKTCTTKDDPCSTDNSVIRYDPRYENVGDQLPPEIKDDLLKQTWRGAIYLNGNRMDYENQTDVPEEDEDERSIFDLKRELTPESGGGPHTVEVRLDHKDNYATQDWEGFVDDPQGVVGERTEQNECPDEDASGLDNTYCITFYFEDTNAPVVEESRLVREDAEGEEEEFTDEDTTVPQIVEGSNVTFEADVKDSSLTGVRAVFEHADGSQANLTDSEGNEFSELEMEPVADEEDVWRAKTVLHGNLTQYTYKVVAEDINHTTEHTFGEFDLVQLPIDVKVDQPDGGGFSVNGERSFGSSPPQYQGTADEPENTFNISAAVNGTGHPEDEVADHVSIEVLRPNGTSAGRTDVDVITRCMYTEGIQDDTPQPGEGEECQESGTQTNHSYWNAYYADSSDEDVDIELDWVGSFDVVYHVEDEFGRNATIPTTGKIADRPNEDGGVEPIIDNGTVSPTAVDPGDAVEASIEAYDVLRVENVTLNITKPGGSTVQAPLKVDELEDQSTMNGTYAGSFDVGPDAEYFDQGGTYEVQLAAEDFAGHFADDEVVSVVVNDTQHPEIVDFTTIPNGTQEVGGPITWIAQIDDDTAVKTPILRVNRPNSGPTGDVEMTYNETRDRWEQGPMQATEVDVGTWTYDLTVEDHTGKRSTATGEIQVEENLPPQDVNWTPAVEGPDGNSYGPAQPTISVDIVDYGQGVNLSSINFTLNDEELTDEAEITSIDKCTKCYQLRYTPDEAFEADSTVDVTIEAADISEPPRQSDPMRHQFTVDDEAPQAGLEMGPSMTTSDDRRVIGIPTDLEVSVSDGGSGPGASEVTVTDADPEGSGASQSITLAGGEGTFRLQELEEVVDGHGDYHITVEAEDAVGNTADPVEHDVLFDKLGPSIEVFAEPGKPREVVFANVTDDADIQKVTARYSVDDGPEQTLPLEEDEGTWSVRLYNQRTDDAFQKGSTVRFTVEATDLFGNVRSSPEKNFTAGDSVPEVSFAEPEEGAELTGDTQLTWTADDAETPTDELRISLFYKMEGGTFEEIPDAQDIPNQGTYTLDTTALPNGDVTLQVFVLDGQNFAADEVNVTVRNLGDTFSAPEIEDARQEDGRDVLAPQQETTFRVQIDGNVRSAHAEIRLNGTVVDTIELENTGGSTWQGTFAAPADRGEYSVDLVAETDEGTQEAPSAYAFSVQGEPEGDNFIPEWTLLTALTATAVALGALGLRSRWT